MAEDAKVTCDGKDEDLKASMPVQVTTHNDDKTVATAVDSEKHIPAMGQKAYWLRATHRGTAVAHGFGEC